MISNVFKILDKQQKLNFILVLMFMLLSAVFEVVSISAVPSLIYFINNPEANLFNNSLLYSFNILKFLNYNNFLIILSFIVVFIFVLKKYGEAVPNIQGKQNNIYNFGLKDKKKVAEDILNKIIEKI